jgi:hypothetical protein
MKTEDGKGATGLPGTERDWYRDEGIPTDTDSLELPHQSVCGLGGHGMTIRKNSIGNYRGNALWTR